MRSECRGAAIENARLAQTAWPAATASGSQRVAWSSSRVGSEVPLATAPAEVAAGCGNGNSRKRRGCLSKADARGQTERGQIAELERENGVGSGVLGKWREASTEDETAEWLVRLECMAGRGGKKGWIE